MKTSKFFSILILILVMFIFAFGWTYSSNWWEGVKKTSEYNENLWREVTSPLPRDIVMDLCTKFELSDSDPLCNFENNPYGGDFYPVIEETLTPKNREWADYDEVMRLLGDYLIFCGDTVESSNGGEYFRCEFDLRGDREFLIVLLINSDDTIRKLFLNLDLE